MDEAKTREERIKELLDAPAIDELNQIKGPSLATQVPDELVKQDNASDDEDDSPKDKKVRIRASRLNKLTTELETLQQERQKDLERIAALETQRNSPRDTEDDVPDYWKAAWGDSEASRKAYHDQQRIMKEEFDRRFSEVQLERAQEEQARLERQRSIEESFDTQMDSLEDTLGRDLTDNQKAEILGIVEEYSPQENGQYVAFMPIEKAYDIWSRSNSTGSAKNRMAEIAGAASSGGSVGTNVNSGPPQWGGWRSRFPAE